jgi:hypothetical protein
MFKALAISDFPAVLFAGSGAKDITARPEVEIHIDLPQC